jgi:FkbM family methyltransferase
MLAPHSSGAQTRRLTWTSPKAWNAFYHFSPNLGDLTSTDGLTRNPRVWALLLEEKMNRQLNAHLLLGIVKNAKYIPAIISHVKNWPTYFLYYLGVKKGGGTFILRNGVTISDREGTASGTIAVVFIRKQYGSITGKNTIVEIGANIGTFAVYAATSDSRVRLYSYEPIKANYDVLLKNIATNGCGDRITAFNMGVASRTEERMFYLASSPEHSLCKSDIPVNGTVTVDCLSLNDVLSNNSISKVDLLKVNAEGAEYEILYATPKECFDKIDEIRMEYHQQDQAGCNLASLRSFLETMGYTTTHLYEYKAGEGFLWMKRGN